MDGEENDAGERNFTVPLDVAEGDDETGARTLAAEGVRFAAEAGLRTEGVGVKQANGGRRLERESFMDPLRAVDCVNKRMRKQGT
jgi:hypothetical protein